MDQKLITILESIRKDDAAMRYLFKDSRLHIESIQQKNREKGIELDIFCTIKKLLSDHNLGIKQ